MIKAEAHIGQIIEADAGGHGLATGASLNPGTQITTLPDAGSPTGGSIGFISTNSRAHWPRSALGTRIASAARELVAWLNAKFAETITTNHLK